MIKKVVNWHRLNQLEGFFKWFYVHRKRFVFILWMSVVEYLVLVWIFHQHTLFHAVGHDCVTSQGCNVRSNHRKHLCYEGVQEATNATFLQRTHAHVSSLEASLRFEITLGLPAIVLLIPPVRTSSLWWKTCWWSQDIWWCVSRGGRRAESSSPRWPSCLQMSGWSAVSGSAPQAAGCCAPEMRLQEQREQGDVRERTRKENKKGGKE